MNDIQKRFLFFLFGCILIRTLFVVIAKEYPTYLPVMGSLALFPALGFFYIYFTDSRKTGDEVFGDTIWWNDLRPLHGTLYLLFGIMALNSEPQSWIILFLDVMIGLCGFILFHFQHGNFEKLIQ
jgi:hypothetical protein